ncbi:hypothetical protein OBBRIDRAFT_592822 [Obba rivulosa]|uniref:Uncharacterized protein n=1 Tax=Obba rivulosa TaxID=1052685 RepID=A0A8E2AT92_9APHY|nr:hypothetical protein OBBRIDRAFT_592822 [Obba rivulosa]
MAYAISLASSGITFTNVGVCRGTFSAITHRAAYRPSSALPAVLLAPALRPFGIMQRPPAARWASTTAASPLPPQTDLDSSQSGATDPAVVSLHSPDMKRSSATSYLISKQTWEGWEYIWSRSPKARPDDIVRVLDLDFREAAAVFISIVNDASLETVQKEDAATLLNLITTLPEARDLRKLMKHHAMYLLAGVLVETHPLHAIHAMSLVCTDQSHGWEWVASKLALCGHWDWVIVLVEVQLRQNGRSTTTILNYFLESCIERGTGEDPNEVLLVFAEAGATPNRRTRMLLARLATSPPASVSDPDSFISPAPTPHAHISPRIVASTEDVSHGVLPARVDHSDAVAREYVGSAGREPFAIDKDRAHRPDDSLPEATISPVAGVTGMPSPGSVGPDALLVPCGASEAELVQAAALNLCCLRHLVHTLANQDENWTGLAQKVDDWEHSLRLTKPALLLPPS